MQEKIRLNKLRNKDFVYIFTFALEYAGDAYNLRTSDHISV